MDAQVWVDQSLVLCQEAHDLDGIAWSMYDAGYLAFMRGELAQAEQLLTESLVRFREQSFAPGLTRKCLSLGHVARAQGNLVQAKMWYQECIRQPIPGGQEDYIAYPVAGLAVVLGIQGQVETATRLLGAAETFRERSGIRLLAVDRAAYERDVATIRAQVDDATFAAAWAAGRAMTLEQAIAEALDEATGPVI